MTTWADAHRRAATLAAELHGDLGVPLDRPVDIFEAITRLGLVLAFAPLGKVSGLYLPQAGGTPGILLHSGHPRTRQRYTAGHELGHHAFGHSSEVDLDLEQSLMRGDVERWPDEEKEAEAFGAWFLMPRRIIRAALAQLGMEQVQSPLDVYALSLWLGTSYAATARQLATVRLISRADAERLVHVQPRTIKRAIAGPLSPHDLRNDVWLLDRRSSGHTVDTRPGDRLVLTLEEIPSSGFTWRFADMPSGFRVLADSFEADWEPDRGGSPQPNDDLAGFTQARSLVVEIDREADASMNHLSLIKDQPWSHDAPSAEFDLLVKVTPPLRGVQVSERELAITA